MSNCNQQKMSHHPTHMQNKITFPLRKEKLKKKQTKNKKTHTQNELTTHTFLPLAATTEMKGITKETSNHITDTLANQCISKPKITN